MFPLGLILCLIYSLGSACVIDMSSPTYVGQPACGAIQPKLVAVESPPPCLCKPAVVNPKLALYQKFPLLYKIRAKKCDLLCGNLSELKPCAPLPIPAPCAPAPIVELPSKCSTCSAPASVISPAILASLLALQQPQLQLAESCPCCSQ
ncbi:hypothetical protein ABEB36_002875 [Hypothenemus hampei]|uniref:Bifunctional inhibitor/plant lipid transfer protein/seed storage helical domain-containing protein n=1 Tax=Hypothenemus hampei TaxID=57062 RepID=A0ABD1F952_HYPHA